MGNVEILERSKNKGGRRKGQKDRVPRKRRGPNGAKAIMSTIGIKDILKSQGPAALDVLIDVMNDEGELTANRIKCASEILARAYGMPTRVVDAKMQFDVTGEFLEALKVVNAKGQKALKARVIDAECIEDDDI